MVYLENFMKFIISEVRNAFNQYKTTLKNGKGNLKCTLYYQTLKYVKINLIKTVQFYAYKLLNTIKNFFKRTMSLVNVDITYSGIVRHNMVNMSILTK